MSLTIILTLAVIFLSALAMGYRDAMAKARRYLQESVEWSDSWNQLARQCEDALCKGRLEIQKLRAGATASRDSNGVIRYHVANGICDLLLFWVETPCAFRDEHLGRMLRIMTHAAPDEVVQPWVSQILERVKHQDIDGARQSAKAMARQCRLPEPVESAPVKRGEHLFDAVATVARPCGGREVEQDNTVRVSLERRE